LFIVHSKMHEHLISFLSNVPIRRVRSKLCELERAGWVVRSVDTWWLVCDKKRIVDTLARMRQRVATSDSDDLYLCPKCEKKFSALALVNQFEAIEEGFYCPTCTVLLVDNVSSTIVGEIDNITKLLLNDDNVLTVT